MKIAIIGAGLAGTACAYVLKEAGLSPHIYEAGDDIAGGASGNPFGLVNPRLAADRTPESDFYAASFALAVRVFTQIQKHTDIGWRQCGGLHLMAEGKKSKRFPQTVENWGWPPEHMRLIDAVEASEIAGIELDYEALYLPDAGFLSPRKLCRFYVENVPITLNARIENMADIKADAVILACGAGVKNFPETNFLPVGSVRGQITEVAENDASSRIRCNIGYGGYIAPSVNGKHVLGATFQRWLDHSDILPEDDVENLRHLQEVIPSLAGDYQVLGTGLLSAQRRRSFSDYRARAGA
ncbi:MAG: FAD-dependent 5-carboxymethylaminomethyl-2-thiouridine(34) oxidoreductase MnmC [Alphaproteobacteria bacterium]|nr:FAD-dependent 5-carboxymethylaminomethyl-2-thiouridine(34) oxidoreductase MnmC [Alphaproteobacteria bacterium]